MASYDDKRFSVLCLPFWFGSLVLAAVCAASTVGGRGSDLTSVVCVASAVLCLAIALSTTYLRVRDIGDALRVGYEPLPVFGAAIRYEDIESFEETWISPMSVLICSLPGLPAVFPATGGEAVRIDLRRRLAALWFARTAIIETDEPDELLEMLKAKMHAVRCEYDYSQRILLACLGMVLLGVLLAASAVYIGLLGGWQFALLEIMLGSPLLLLHVAFLPGLRIRDTGDALLIRGTLVHSASLRYDQIESVEKSKRRWRDRLGVGVRLYESKGRDGVRINLRKARGILRIRTILILTEDADNLFEFLRGKVESVVHTDVAR